MAKKRAKVSDTSLFESTDSKKVSQLDSKTAKEKSEEKVKNTYYLTQETDARLEMARVILRGITGKKLSKSEIIEAALVSALNELDTRGEQSYLAVLLSK